MGKFLFLFVGFVVIGVVALGFYRGWFTASRETDEQGTEIKLKIHREKVQKDLETFQTKPASQETEDKDTEKQLKVDREKIQKDRETFQKKAEATLKDLEVRLEELKAKVRKADAETRAQLNQMIEELTRKMEVIRRNLAEVKTATAERWEEVKSKFDAALDDLQEGFTKALSRFK